jgi:hypothetical protein
MLAQGSRLLEATHFVGLLHYSPKVIAKICLKLSLIRSKPESGGFENE